MMGFPPALLPDSFLDFSSVSSSELHAVGARHMALNCQTLVK